MLNKPKLIGIYFQFLKNPVIASKRSDIKKILESWWKALEFLANKTSAPLPISIFRSFLHSILHNGQLELFNSKTLVQVFKHNFSFEIISGVSIETFTKYKYFLEINF